MTVGVKMLSNTHIDSFKRVICLVLTAVFIFAFSACDKGTDKAPFTNSTIAMGTVITQALYSDNEATSKDAVAGITSLINDLDVNKLSRNSESSEVSKLNKNKECELSEVTHNCILKCNAISKKTDGLFDITVGELTSLWGIGTENARVPSEEEIDALLPRVNFRRVLTSDSAARCVTIGEDQTIDLGAVGKGLACDEARAFLSKTKVIGGTVSVGGSILVYGTNPEREDGTFNVGVRNPFGSESDYMGIISTGEKCISTSGDYEKVLEVDGVKYHHILDPMTGHPAKSNITSVTVVSDSGIISDALSTSCFILGYSDTSLTLLKDYDCEAIFITKDKEVYVTSGLANNFTLIDNTFTLK